MSDNRSKSPAALLTQIDEASRAGDWDAVRRLARQLLRADPDNDDAPALLRQAERNVRPRSPHAVRQASPPPTDAVAAGRYVLGSTVDQDSDRIVYAAVDSQSNRDVLVALSQHPRGISTRRIHLEAHPCIVPVLDSGDENGLLYAVFRPPIAGDLGAHLAGTRSRRLPLNSAHRIARDIAAGLQHIHDRGCIHGVFDVASIWLTGDGAVQLLALGLDEPDQTARYEPEHVTPRVAAHLAPEQIRGQPATALSDLYSLGTLLYELLAGRPPFQGDDTIAIFGQHVNTPPPAPDLVRLSCPSPLSALVLSLLAKDPAERTQSAQDLLKALNDAARHLGGGPPEAEPAGASPITGFFVGRRPEVAIMRAAVGDAVAGRGRLLMVVGEPGIGKTRLVEEAAAYAGLRGARIHWGRCYEDAGAPPYWPWAQVLGGTAGGLSDAEVARAVGARQQIVELVPELRERLPTAELPPSTSDPRAARFHLFESVVSFLRAASGVNPLVIAIDDLHWADTASLRLLELAAHELADSHVLLVGTYRDAELNRQHPLARTLADLARERGFQRILLRGLEPVDVARYLELAMGAVPHPRLARALSEQTEGNPFFVAELVRLLAQDQNDWSSAPTAALWERRLPEGIREAIGRRLDRISPAAAQALTTAAVIGREFCVHTLAMVTGADTSEDAISSLLEQAEAAHLIEAESAPRPTFRFTHALIQEALLNEISLARRVRLHAQIADCLEQELGAAAASHASELVRHLAAAEGIVGRDKLQRYALLAGDAALAASAYDEAQQQFLLGLDDPHCEPQDRATAALLFGLARAQSSLSWGYWSRQPDSAHTSETDLPFKAAARAATTLARCVGFYERTDDLPRMREAASFRLRHGTLPVPLLERVLGKLDPASPAAGGVLAQLGLSIYMREKDYQRASAQFERALTLARAADDAALEANVLVAWAFADLGERNFRARLQRCLRVIALASEVDDPYSLYWAHLQAFLSLTNLDLDAMNGHLQALLPLAERLREPWALEQAYYQAARVAVMRGDWDAARAKSDHQLTLQPDAVRLLTWRAIIEYLSGEEDTARHYVNRVMDELPSDARIGPDVIFLEWFWIAELAELSANQRLIEMARKQAAELLPTAQLPNQLAHRHEGLARMLVAGGDLAAAAAHYHILCKLELPEPRNQLQLGRIARAVGELDRSAEHLAAAAAFYRRFDFAAVRAQACCEYAATLLARNAAGDVAAARPLLQEAHRLAQATGLAPVLAHLDRLEGQVPDGRNAPAAHPDGLTPREVDVLHEVARGQTNQEIAATLNLSAKTVANYLNRTFAKIGVGNRTEAASYFLRRQRPVE